MLKDMWPWNGKDGTETFGSKQNGWEILWTEYFGALVRLLVSGWAKLFSRCWFNRELSNPANHLFIMRFFLPSFDFCLFGACIFGVDCLAVYSIYWPSCARATPWPLCNSSQRCNHLPAVKYLGPRKCLIKIKFKYLLERVMLGFSSSSGRWRGVFGKEKCQTKNFQTLAGT